MIYLDGSIGGGQVLRTALALSTLTQKPFRITNIRKNRQNPGLQAQHIACVKALEIISEAKSEGNELGSSELLFIPGKILGKNATIDIGTAGSITLLLQAILIPSMFASKSHTLTIIGGTDTKWSMPIDYFANVLAPFLSQFAKIDVRLIKRGYYPKGGGKVEIAIKPKIKQKDFPTFEDFLTELKKYAFNFSEKETLFSIKGISHASSDLEQREVSERQAIAVKSKLTKIGVPVEISSTYYKAHSTGSGITLWAMFSRNEEASALRIGADEIGERGKSTEDVGILAAQKLIRSLSCPVDAHLADNLLVLMAIAKPSKICVEEITDHVKSTIAVINQFLGSVFVVEENTIST